MAKNLFSKLRPDIRKKPGSTKNDINAKSFTALKDKLKEQSLVSLGGANIANALIASIGEGLIIVNEYGYIEQVNQTGLEILGYERHQLLGKWYPDVLKIYDSDDKPISDYDRPIIRALLTGKAITQVVNYKKQDGSIAPTSVTASPFLVGNKPKGAVVIFRDVTKETQIDRAKDEFVSIASHQLRSPLTSIRLFTELLIDSSKEKLNKKELGYIEKVLFSTEKMLNLATDLLNISRLELGQLTIRPQPTNLDRLLKVRLEEIRPVAIGNNIQLNYDNQLTKVAEVPVDRDLLGQVVHNLLSNAVRYSSSNRAKKGHVEVVLSKNARNYKITVADNGIGIPQKDRSKIFERFYRANNAISLQPEGTGLGLYLVKAIIESSGGSVSYKSQEGKGTTFNIFIPLAGMNPPS